MAAGALAVALASLMLHLHGGRWGYWPRSPALPPGAARHRHFARLALRLLVHFGIVALGALALDGRLDAIVRFPVELEPARALALRWDGWPSWPWMAAGAAIGVVVAAVLDRRRPGLTLGDLRAVTPARRAELGWGVLLAVTAGVTEEVFFRLLLPLTIASLSGSPVAGFAVATMLFGYAHRYQGWRGMAATTIVGAMLSMVYLVSGRLWVAMLVHAAIDLNSLVLRPLLGGRLNPVRPAG